MDINPYSAVGAVFVAEAANNAAKVLDDRYYAIKPELWALVAQFPGVASGWGEDGCFFLSAPGAGTVCAHDPGGPVPPTDNRLTMWALAAVLCAMGLFLVVVVV